MNITNYLVDYLKLGNNVEIPQIGILAIKEIAAHYDIESATFYPTTYTLEMSRQMLGDTAFVEYLAQKECVSVATAERFLKNYGDALAAKIEKEGECQLGELGVFSKTAAGTYSFQPQPNLNLGEKSQISAPVSGVKYFAEQATADPFAVYEQPFEEIQPEPEPIAEPEPVVEPEPEPVVEPEPAVEPEPEPEPVVEEPIVDEEPEPVVEPEPEPVAEEPAPAEPEETDHPVEPEQPAEDKEEPTAEKEEPAAFAPAENDDTISTLKQLDAIEHSDGDDFFDDTKKKKKKKGGCLKTILFTLLGLIVLLACAFALDHYLLNSKGRNWVADKTGMEQLKMTVEEEESLPEVVTTKDNDAEQTEENIISTEEQENTGEASGKASKHIDPADRDNITNHTFSLEGITFDANEKAAATDEVMANMDNYLSQYLKRRNQLKNKELFMSQVKSFVGDRFESLLPDQEYDPYALLSYRDYVRESYMDVLKRLKFNHKIGDIQGELMEQATLDALLDKMIEDNGLTAAPQTLQKEKTQVQSQIARQNNTVRTDSKQGFDIIALVSTSKTTAQNESARLKAKGCDAYVIDKNGLYYVSMGSADSRTAAEKKYWHIKEWYKGDISIKQW
ncbi:MAG: hypothetical protein K5864_05005 [Bacteroidales bacterium]|nr:hypothetical protein [Bacteroidales bacterium]